MDFKNEKISFLSTEPKMKRAEIIIFLEKKIIEFQDIINETIISKFPNKMFFYFILFYISFIFLNYKKRKGA